VKNTDKKDKKGFMAAIWESMTKTGGCCGSGESCCCSPKPNDDKKQNKEKKDPPKTKGSVG